MSLNIKNERVHALAREAARVTGKTQTSAIEEALELLLKNYGSDPVAADRERRLDIIRNIALEWEERPAAEGTTGSATRTTSTTPDGTARMIVDASALVAILRDEPEREEFARLLLSTPARISAANWLEATMVADGSGMRPAGDSTGSSRQRGSSSSRSPRPTHGRPGSPSVATVAGPAHRPGSTSVTASRTR